MQILMIVRDELGGEIGVYPAHPNTEPYHPNGINIGPGGTVDMAFEVPAAGRYRFIVQAYDIPEGEDRGAYGIGPVPKDSPQLSMIQGNAIREDGV